MVWFTFLLRGRDSNMEWQQPFNLKFLKIENFNFEKSIKFLHPLTCMRNVKNRDKLGAIDRGRRDLTLTFRGD